MTALNIEWHERAMPISYSDIRAGCTACLKCEIHVEITRSDLDHIQGASV